MGLLDLLNSEQGLLGMSLLAAAAPKPVRTSFGEGLLQATQNVQAMRNAQEDRALKKRMMDMQLAGMEAQAQERKRLQEMEQRRGQYLGALDANQGPPMQPTAAGALAAGLSPQEYGMVAPQQAQAPQYKVVGGSLVKIGPDGVSEAYRAPEKADLNSLIVPGPDGKPTLNTLLLDAKRQIARDGAMQIGMPKIEVKTGEGLASQVGPMMRDSKTQAEAGLRLVDSANRILDAAEKGSIFAGPTANLQLKGAQIADAFGFGGKSLQEKIKNTRDVVRGMAEQAVSARAQLGGQAQISNAEQELLNKATAGDIAELTAGEIIQIAKLNDRLGRKLYDNHQRQLQVMQQRPDLQGVAQFYTVPEIPKARGSATVVRTGRDAQGRKVEQLSDGTIRYVQD